MFENNAGVVFLHHICLYILMYVVCTSINLIFKKKNCTHADQQQLCFCALYLNLKLLE